MKVSLKINREARVGRQGRKAARETKVDKENQNVNFAPKVSSKGTGLGNGNLRLNVKGADKENTMKQHSLLPLADPHVYQAQHEALQAQELMHSHRLETVFTENFRNVQFSPTSSCASAASNSMRNAYQSHNDAEGLSTPSECNQYQSGFAKRYFMQQKRDRLADEEYMRVIANDYSECKGALAESDSESYQPLR